jgi:tetratricopeptide (TPR) repeat protein
MTASKNIPSNAKIKGVFSRRCSTSIGSGGTKKASPNQIYYYAREEEDGDISVHPLNANFVPAELGQMIKKDELLSDFEPEPSIYMNKVVPAMRRLKKAIARGESHREEGEHSSAEYEFENALEIDEDNARATFGLGLNYLDMDEPEKAAEVFEKLVTLEAAFKPEHKHLFNEFGIGLRKSGLHDEALQYYLRAGELSSQDEHLLLNVARVHHEQGNDPAARKHLERALEMNPEFEEARKFVEYLEGDGT